MPGLYVEILAKGGHRQARPAKVAEKGEGGDTFDVSNVKDAD